jgi:hypothetical protein
MTRRIIETEYERRQAIRFIEGHKLPMTIGIEAIGKRSARQNRLNRQWMLDIAGQMEGWSAEYTRGYCKLHFGIPILRADDEEFCREYDALVRPLPYEHKIKLMMVPFDFGVTRRMTTKQQTAYLDAVHRHFSEQGVALTDPGDLLFAGERRAA